MSRAVSPSVDRAYGLLRVARCWNVSQATGYRHPQAPACPKRRPGPVGPGDDATLRQHIRPAIAESRFTGEGTTHCALPGIHSSLGRVRRRCGRTGCWRRTGSASGRIECTTAPSPPRPWTSCGAPS